LPCGPFAWEASATLLRSASIRLITGAAPLPALIWPTGPFSSGGPVRLGLRW
jgi:hypothetical protein